MWHVSFQSLNGIQVVGSVTEFLVSKKLVPKQRYWLGLIVASVLRQYRHPSPVLNINHAGNLSVFIMLLHLWKLCYLVLS